MAIQDEMYKMIENEINQTIEDGREKVLVDIKKAKAVAKMLSSLSVENIDSEGLYNEYIAKIKIICKS